MKDKKRSFKGVFAVIFLAGMASMLFLNCLPGNDSSKDQAKKILPNAPRLEQGKSDASGVNGASVDQTSGKGGEGAQDSAEDESGLEEVIIIIASPNLNSYEKVEKAVLDLGGKITVGGPPEDLFALIPKGKANQLKGLKEVLIVSSGVVDAQSIPGLTDQQKRLLEKWNKQLKNIVEPTLSPNPPPPPNDARERPPIDQDHLEVHPPKELPQGTSPDGSMLYQDRSEKMAPAPTTSMSGKVAVAIFFPESNGAIDVNKKNWKKTQIQDVISEVKSGVKWWVGRAPSAQNLSFVVVSYSPSANSCMKTSYEPATHSSADEGLWIGQIMTCLGYSSGDYKAKVDSFNAWLAGNKGAGQAYSVFVVNGKTFTDGYFAYAYLGGPFEVMTYSNDGYGISNMDSVHAHETGHIFHALDEYYKPGYGGCTSCSENYNGCPNKNCKNGCSWNKCCIMRGQVTPFTKKCLCDCTRGHIGWGCRNCCAGIGESCDAASCCKGGCIANPGCGWVVDTGATNICYGPCGSWVDCGDGCCSPNYPTCGAYHSCLCYP